ncbi:hypothetical protein ACFQS1_16575 [Paractinoplanes rhizophilus]|uniref:Uncharacterized protein n=1 Tax=Paractinoplanes rhizophilus TaxID=1416877 RepID=A0ABW2HR62_9ACTN
MSDPVLTSSWCTNWGAYNTPRLWSMVMNEDDAPGRQQVSAWRTLAGSVRSQRAALLTARAELVAAWPPEENESSAAFVNELDILIARLDTASADADATASGLDNILTAIQTAKTTIQPLWEKYKDKSDDLVPRWWDNAEDEIDEQARRAMISAERAVEDSVALLKVPEKYELSVGDKFDEPGSGEDTGGHGRTTSGSSGISAAVPHNPPPTLPGQNPTVPDGGGPGGSDTGGSVVGGTAGIGAGAGGGGAVSDGGGPDLAGVITPPGGASALPSGGDTVGFPGGGGTLPTGGGGGGGPVSTVPGLLPTGGGAPIAPSGRVPRGGGARPTRPALPGGVIGEPAGGGGAGRSGIGALGQIGTAGGRGAAGGRAGRTSGGGLTESGSTGGRGIRTGTAGSSEGLGGVGAGRGAGARGSTARGRASRPPRPSWLPDDPVGPNRNAGVAGGVAGRGGRRSGGDDDGYGFDPDNPWQVAEGVDPVIAPSTDDPRHDPGPNVIGWRG